MQLGIPLLNRPVQPVRDIETEELKAFRQGLDAEIQRREEDEDEPEPVVLGSDPEKDPHYLTPVSTCGCGSAKPGIKMIGSSFGPECLFCPDCELPKHEQ